jgi:pyrroloquinoline-quinone synthase
MKLRRRSRRGGDSSARDDRAVTSSEWFWCELDLRAQRWDALEHVFYEDWTRGRLRVDQLASYAEEFDHLVAAHETGWDHAARKAGSGIHGVAIAHAAEQAPRLHLWRAFARATGWDLATDYWYGADPHPATRECARLWSGDESRPLAVDLLTLYLIEVTQRSLSIALLEGLRHHYHLLADDATMYFRIQARDSRVHAVVARAALQAADGWVDPFKLLSHAEALHRAYWEMVDTLAHSGSSS